MPAKIRLAVLLGELMFNGMMTEDRYQRGWEKLKEADGEAGPEGC